jgi:nucleoside-specific outer membrane channel protein Tsx
LNNLKPRTAIALAASVLASSAFAAEDWSANAVSVRWGPSFAEPAIDSKISKQIYNFTHAGHDSLGRNLFSVDLLLSDDKDPPSGGGGGAQEFYGFYQRSFSLSSLTGKPVAFGPIKDLSLYGRFDANTKNIDFAPRVRKYRLGLSADMPVPAGFWDVSLGIYKEQNHNGIIIPVVKPAGVNVSFKVVPEVMSSWMVPVGPLGAFEGYADYIPAKGDNGFGAATKAETHVQATFMFNLGGPRAAWQAGVGFEYWNHKYGEIGTGTNQLTGLVQLRYNL